MISTVVVKIPLLQMNKDVFQIILSIHSYSFDQIMSVVQCSVCNLMICLIFRELVVTFRSPKFVSHIGYKIQRYHIELTFWILDS
jgi:hypothetical protein